MKRGACHNTNLVLAIRKVSRPYTNSCAARRTFYIINAGATKRTEHPRRTYLNNIMNTTAAKKNYNSYDKFLYSTTSKFMTTDG